MRYFIIDIKPTNEQLKEIGDGKSLLDGNVLGDYYRDKYLIAMDDEKYNIPKWLENAQNLNVPGEPHRCWNCGEVYK